MKTIFKTIFIASAGYIGLNWAADNPMKVKVLRKEVNQAVEDGYDVASSELQKQLNTAK